MNLSYIDAYLARNPNAELIEAEYPHCGAALNALFGREVWIRDEDIEEAPMEEGDDDLRPNLGAAPEEVEARRQRLAPCKHKLQWRAPIETLSGPCTLWRETHAVLPDRDAINLFRAHNGTGPLPEGAPELQPQSYTAYTLVCAVDKLGDADFQLFTRMCDRHNLSLGIMAASSKVLVQLSMVR